MSPDSTYLCCNSHCSLTVLKFKSGWTNGIFTYKEKSISSARDVCQLQVAICASGDLRCSYAVRAGPIGGSHNGASWFIVVDSAVTFGTGELSIPEFRRAERRAARIDYSFRLIPFLMVQNRAIRCNSMTLKTCQRASPLLWKEPLPAQILWALVSRTWRTSQWDLPSWLVFLKYCSASSYHPVLPLSYVDG